MVSSTQQKLDELEMLQSIYPGQIDIDPEDQVNCLEHVDSLDCFPPLRFTVSFSSIELAVMLPGNYPASDSPQIRISSTRLSPQQDKEIIDKITSTLVCNKGDATILQVISEVSELLNDIASLVKADEDEMKTAVAKDEICCRMWYYAHHIYSREKRTNMLQWSKNLSLNGFILPGKPGIICIEGSKRSCKEFNSLVRAMNWQLLKLQHEEFKLSPPDIKFDSFKELIFDVHGRANTHQDLGQFREHLNGLGMHSIFEKLFHLAMNFSIVKMVFVALLWGSTNPLIKKFSKGIENCTSPLQKAWFLCTKPLYLISLLSNQLGSVLFYALLGSTELGVTVPVVNSLTLIFTCIVGFLLGEERFGKIGILGTVLIIAGTALCNAEKQ